MQLEKKIEQDFVKYAQSKNCLAIKFQDPNRNGAPDRIILCPNGRIFFIEFKRGKEGKIKIHQKRYAKTLNELGFNVYFCRTLIEAKNILDNWLNSWLVNKNSPLNEF